MPCPLRRYEVLSGSLPKKFRSFADREVLLVRRDDGTEEPPNLRRITLPSGESYWVRSEGRSLLEDPEKFHEEDLETLLASHPASADRTAGLSRIWQRLCVHLTFRRKMELRDLRSVSAYLTARYRLYGKTAEKLLNGLCTEPEEGEAFLRQAIRRFFREELPAAPSVLPEFSWEKKCLKVQVCGEVFFLSSVPLASAEPGEPFLLTGDLSGFPELEGALNPGTGLNLLEPAFRSGVCVPKEAVLEPLDVLRITDISQCVKQGRTIPALAQLSLFSRPDNCRDVILLGNLAGRFLDDAVRTGPGKRPDGNASLQNFFRSSLLPLSAMEMSSRGGRLRTEKEWYEEAKQLFRNISESIPFFVSELGMDWETCRIEPSFFCGELGIQGRMDCFGGSPDSEEIRIIEMKSGSAGLHGTSRPEHQAQLDLYWTAMKHLLKIREDHALAVLFYSKLPDLRYQAESRNRNRVLTALRNRIIADDWKIAEGAESAEKVFGSLEQEIRDADRALAPYEKKRCEEFFTALHRLDPAEKQYFFRQLSFAKREQILAKVSPKSGAFYSLWNRSTEEKIRQGAMLEDLRVRELVREETRILSLVFSFSVDQSPDFRPGDPVILYESRLRNHTLLLKGTVILIRRGELSIALTDPQNSRCFRQEELWCCEHDSNDRIFDLWYGGLGAFLTAPQKKKDWILGRSFPEPGAPEGYELVSGPPGTGKTRKVMYETVRRFLQTESGNILLTAYTNQAVDEISAMLETLPGHPDYIRIGSVYGCAAPFRKRLLNESMKGCASRQEFRERFSRVRIVTGTVASLSGRTDLFRLKTFRTILTDEASQLPDLSLLSLFCRTEKMILIGDSRQLSAVVLQEMQDSIVSEPLLTTLGFRDCRESFFERIQRQGIRNSHPCCRMLRTQYRMHPELSRFPNEFFYDGQLEDGDSPHQQETGNCFAVYDPSDPAERISAERRRALILSPSGGAEEGEKHISFSEARSAALLAEAYFRLCRKNGLPFTERTLGIITVFRNQIRQIRQELEKRDLPSELVTVDTVERFQGSTRDVIFYSPALETSSEIPLVSRISEDPVTGKVIDRKLNVALTRARKQFFLLGDPVLFRQVPFYEELAQSLPEEALIFPPFPAEGTFPD